MVVPIKKNKQNQWLKQTTYLKLRQDLFVFIQNIRKILNICNILVFVTLNKQINLTNGKRV